MSNPLGDVEQLYANLQRILELLGQVQVKAETVRLEAVHVSGVLREAEYIAYRVTSILSRIGLPKEIDRAIMLIQRMVLVIRMLETSLRYMMATTPYGWIIASLGVIGATVTLSAVEVNSR